MMALVAVLPWLAGCGDEGGDVVPVSGTVTLNGQPLPGASVLFAPTADSTGTSGTDTTGPEGNYKIQFNGRFGVAPGKYTVLVSKQYNPALASGGDVTAEEDPDMARVAADSLMQGQQGRAATKQEAKIIEVKETFDREVKAGEPQVFEFDLKASAEDAKLLRDNP